MNCIKTCEPAADVEFHHEIIHTEDGQSFYYKLYNSLLKQTFYLDYSWFRY